MAAVPREPASGAPGATSAARPSYRLPANRTRVVDWATTSGRIAVPRDQPRDAGGAFVLSPDQQAASDTTATRAAAARVERAGLDASAVPYVVDYFRSTGRFPDLAALDAEGAGAAAGAPGLPFGVSPTMLAIAGGAVLVLLLMRRK